MRQLAIVLVVLVLLAVPAINFVHGQTSSGHTPITSDNAAALEPLVTLHGGLQAVEDIAFSADGSLLAAGGYHDCAADADRHTCPGRVVVWNVVSRDVLVSFDAHTGPVTSVDFSPDGSRVAALGEDGQIRLWALPGGNEIAVFDNGQGVGDVTFNLDSTLLASTGSEGAVRVWSLTDITESRPIYAGYSTKVGLAFSPVEPLVALGGFREVGLWQVRDSNENGGIVNVPSANLRAGPGTGYSVLDVALVGDELIILGANEQGDWYNIETADGLNAWIAGYLVDTGDVAGRAPREIATMTLPFDGEIVATDLAFSPDGRRFASANFNLTSSAGSISVWEKELTLVPAAEGTAEPTPAPEPESLVPSLVASFPAQGEIAALAFNQDGSLIAFADTTNSALRLWVVGEQAERAAFETPISTLDFSTDGTWLAGGRSDGTVELWGVPEG